jgi:hypothetical protein
MMPRTINSFSALTVDRDLLQAVNDRQSPAYQELYSYLVSCFVRADKNMDGTVTFILRAWSVYINSI